MQGALITGNLYGMGTAEGMSTGVSKLRAHEIFRLFEEHGQVGLLLLIVSGICSRIL
jgi:hypothetical protein